MGIGIIQLVKIFNRMRLLLSNPLGLKLATIFINVACTGNPAHDF